MHLTRYVAREMKGRRELNTLDYIEDWRLVEIQMYEEEPEPDAQIESGEDDDDDWELVEISAVNTEEG